MKNAQKKKFLLFAFYFFCASLSAQNLQGDYRKKLEIEKKHRELEEVIANLDRDAIKYQCDTHTLAFSRGEVFIKRADQWSKELHAPYELSKDYVTWSMRKPIGAYYTNVYFDFHFNSNQLYSKVMIVNEYGRDITPDFFQLWDLMGKQIPGVLDEHAKLTQCALLSENNALPYKFLNKVAFEGKFFTSVQELQKTLENDGYLELEHGFRAWQKGSETLVFSASLDSSDQVGMLLVLSNTLLTQSYKKYKTIDQLVRFLEKNGWQENKYSTFMSRSDTGSDLNKPTLNIKNIYIDLQANGAVNKVVRLPDLSVVITPKK